MKTEICIALDYAHTAYSEPLRHLEEGGYNSHVVGQDGTPFFDDIMATLTYDPNAYDLIVIGIEDEEEEPLARELAQDLRSNGIKVPLLFFQSPENPKSLRSFNEIKYNPSHIELESGEKVPHAYMGGHCAALLVAINNVLGQVEESKFERNSYLSGAHAEIEENRLDSLTSG